MNLTPNASTFHQFPFSHSLCHRQAHSTLTLHIKVKRTNISHSYMYFIRHLSLQNVRITLLTPSDCYFHVLQYQDDRCTITVLIIRYNWTEYERCAAHFGNLSSAFSEYVYMLPSSSWLVYKSPQYCKIIVTGRYSGLCCGHFKVIQSKHG